MHFECLFLLCGLQIKSVYIDPVDPESRIGDCIFRSWGGGKAAVEGAR